MLLMGKSTISMAMASIAMFVYQRVYHIYIYIPIKTSTDWPGFPLGGVGPTDIFSGTSACAGLLSWANGSMGYPYGHGVGDIHFHKNNMDHIYIYICMYIYI